MRIAKRTAKRRAKRRAKRNSKRSSKKGRQEGGQKRMAREEGETSDENRSIRRRAKEAKPVTRRPRTSARRTGASRVSMRVGAMLSLCVARKGVADSASISASGPAVRNAANERRRAVRRKSSCGQDDRSPDTRDVQRDACRFRRMPQRGSGKIRHALRVCCACVAVRLSLPARTSVPNVRLTPARGALQSVSRGEFSPRSAIRPSASLASESPDRLRYVRACR